MKMNNKMGNALTGIFCFMILSAIFRTIMKGMIGYAIFQYLIIGFFLWISAELHFRKFINPLMIPLWIIILWHDKTKDWVYMKKIRNYT